MYIVHLHPFQSFQVLIGLLFDQFPNSLALLCFCPELKNVTELAHICISVKKYWWKNNNGGKNWFHNLLCVKNLHFSTLLLPLLSGFHHHLWPPHSYQPHQNIHNYQGDNTWSNHPIYSSFSQLCFTTTVFHNHCVSTNCFQLIVFLTIVFQPIVFHNLNHELIFSVGSTILAVLSIAFSYVLAVHYQGKDMGELFVIVIAISLPLPLPLPW